MPDTPWLSICPAASNPEVATLLPHMRGRGVVDLDYESDGKVVCTILVQSSHACIHTNAQGQQVVWNGFRHTLTHSSC